MDKEKKVGMVPDRYHTTIKLKPGTILIKQKLRPMQPQQQVEQKAQLNESIKEGVIHLLKSLWVSPHFPVKKKDGQNPVVRQTPRGQCLHHWRLHGEMIGTNVINARNLDRITGLCR